MAQQVDVWHSRSLAPSRAIKACLVQQAVLTAHQISNIHHLEIKAHFFLYLINSIYLSMTLCNSHEFSAFAWICLAHGQINRGKVRPRDLWNGPRLINIWPKRHHKLRHTTPNPQPKGHSPNHTALPLSAEPAELGSMRCSVTPPIGPFSAQLSRLHMDLLPSYAQHFCAPSTGFLLSDAQPMRCDMSMTTT